MNEVFNKYILTKRPFVTIKSGVTLDGKIATSSSDSKWITSTEARQEVHQIRNENAAILVGANTVQKDNPSLTAYSKWTKSNSNNIGLDITHTDGS